MKKRSWDLNKDIKPIRKNFPILEHCVYLISNSLGAVPCAVQDGLERFYTLWAEEGVSAWDMEWSDHDDQCHPCPLGRVVHTILSKTKEKKDHHD
jgi:kynureninase